MPAIGDIQRTNLLTLMVASLALLALDSPAASLSCVLGGAVVIGNLFILAMLGRAALSAAAGGSASAVAVALFPMKLLIVAGLVYLSFAHAGVDGVGFAIGVFTQLVAIVIETARARMRRPAQELEIA